MDELKWGSLNSNDYYKVLYRADVVAGWVVLLGNQWIARTADGSVSADFDTMEKAQQFLTVMVSANQ